MAPLYAMSHKDAMPYRIIRACIVLRVKPYELVKELVRQEGGELPVARAMGDPRFQGTLYKFCQGWTESPKRSTAERIAKHFKLPVDAIYDEKLATAIARERGVTVRPEGGGDTIKEMPPRAAREPGASGYWPFPRVSLQRILALPDPDALADIEDHLEIVVSKWEGKAGRAANGTAP